MTPFTPPWWLRNAHAQTLTAALAGAQPSVTWHEETWSSPDDDVLTVARLAGKPGHPVLVLFHGLEGSHRSRYIVHLALAAHSRGWHVVAPSFRACGDLFNRAPRLYHAGDSAEIHWMLHRVRLEYPEVPRYATGFSLGANLLLKWLGELSHQAASWVDRCAAVATPFDLALVGDHLATGFNRLYTQNFLATLKRKAINKQQQFPGLFDLTGALAATTLRQFDDCCMAPLHGFYNAQDYWDRSSCRPFLASIACPTLLLQAEDDPFVPRNALPTAAHLSATITWDLQRHGGHVGFIAQPYGPGQPWMCQRILHHLDAPPSLNPQDIAE